VLVGRGVVDGPVPQRPDGRRGRARRPRRRHAGPRARPYARHARGARARRRDGRPLPPRARPRGSQGAGQRLRERDGRRLPGCAPERRGGDALRRRADASGAAPRRLADDQALHPAHPRPAGGGARA
jgi:hypothetical protein